MNALADTPPASFLEIRGLCCAHRGQPVVRDFLLSLRRGAIACLLGPSGGGKTTVLRAVAGFQPITAGSIRLENRMLADRSQRIPAARRRIGLVPQEPSLFPHLTAYDNIAFGLYRMKGEKVRRQVRQLLDMMDLGEYADHYPHQLSGGQQKRVCLARSLAPRPRLLLLDEPFANLDSLHRKQLAARVGRHLRSQEITTLAVTHDQEEAFILADEIGMLEAGSLQQWGSPYQLYHEPCNRRVAQFVGRGRLIPGTVVEHGRISTTLGVVSGENPCPWEAGTHVDVLVRPDDVVHDERDGIEAVVVGKLFAGSFSLYTLRLPDGELVEALLTYHDDPAVHNRVRIRMQAKHLISFPRKERRAAKTGNSTAGVVQTP